MKKIIICYDITSNKGRRKVDKLLCHYGSRIQYSIFSANLHMKQLMELKKGLRTLGSKPYFNKKSDSIYIFEICDACHKKQWVWGSRLVNERFVVI